MLHWLGCYENLRKSTLSHARWRNRSDVEPCHEAEIEFLVEKKKRNRFFLRCCMFVFDVGDRFSSSIAERRWWSVWIQANKMPTDGGEEIGDEDYNSIIVYVIKQLAHTDLHSIIRFLHLFPSLFLTTLFSFIFFFNFFSLAHTLLIFTKFSYVRHKNLNWQRESLNKKST